MNATIDCAPPGWRRADWPTAATAVGLTALILILGYLAFGVVTMLVFTAGFAGGLLLWLAFPTRGTWVDVRVPFWTALVLFVLHRVEEKQMGFFAFLADVTGVSTPSASSPAVVLLIAASVGAWLLVPVLMKRDVELGRYLGWTFFASMGITELAHFVVFAWFSDASWHYVPGMWTVILLAPVAWWGMWRLARGAPTPKRRYLVSHRHFGG